LGQGRGQVDCEAWRHDETQSFAISTTGRRQVLLQIVCTKTGQAFLKPAAHGGSFD
jgi:hypothetical protein